MGLGLLPTLHRRLQCLDLGYGLRDAAPDAPDFVYVESRAHIELHGLDWVWFAVGDRRLDQCKRAFNVAVFRGLDIYTTVEVSDAAFGSDRGLLIGVPDGHRALGLAQFADLRTVCRLPWQFWAGSDGRKQQRYEPTVELERDPGVQPGRVAKIPAAGRTGLYGREAARGCANDKGSPVLVCGPNPSTNSLYLDQCVGFSTALDL